MENIKLHKLMGNQKYDTNLMVAKEEKTEIKSINKGFFLFRLKHRTHMQLRIFKQSKEGKEICRTGWICILDHLDDKKMHLY